MLRIFCERLIKGYVSRIILQVLHGAPTDLRPPQQWCFDPVRIYHLWSFHILYSYKNSCRRYLCRPTGCAMSLCFAENYVLIIPRWYCLHRVLIKMAEEFKEKLAKYRTAPFDARFPNQNQTRNCWANYLGKSARQGRRSKSQKATTSQLENVLFHRNTRLFTHWSQV